MALSLESRFWNKVAIGTESECWRWNAYVMDNGYGKFMLKEGDKWCCRLAHRMAYEFAIGPIPELLTIDHVADRGCAYKDCCNPAHMEVVTRGENTRRGGGSKIIGAIKASATHCKHGHAYTHDNTYHHCEGYRVCKTCSRASQRKYKMNKKLTPLANIDNPKVPANVNN